MACDRVIVIVSGQYALQIRAPLKKSTNISPSVTSIVKLPCVFFFAAPKCSHIFTDVRSGKAAPQRLDFYLKSAMGRPLRLFETMK